VILWIYQTVIFEPPPNDDIPAYRTNRLYVCIQATTPGILPTNSSYWVDGGNNLATWINNSLELTYWEDNLNTLATWTYGTPPGTTFDGGSMQFAAPVDMYSNNNTTEYDKYLLFPKSNIIQPLPQVNQLFWINNYSEILTWFNNSDQQLIWITESV
jgi:alpha-amylase/alpha-mannosidase (GH57 family)